MKLRNLIFIEGGILKAGYSRDSIKVVTFMNNNTEFLLDEVHEIPKREYYSHINIGNIHMLTKDTLVITMRTPLKYSLFEMLSGSVISNLDIVIVCDL